MVSIATVATAKKGGLVKIAKKGSFTVKATLASMVVFAERRLEDTVVHASQDMMVKIV